MDVVIADIKNAITHNQLSDLQQMIMNTFYGLLVHCPLTLREVLAANLAPTWLSVVQFPVPAPCAKNNIR